MPPGRREKKKELTRSILLDTASNLFAKKGYTATSIDDIVQAASLVKGTFYYHFKSKEDLVLELRKAILMRDFASINTALAAGASPLKLLLELFVRDATWTEENREMAMVFFSQLFGGFMGSTSEPNADSTIAPQILMLVDAAQKSGELREDLNALELSEIIMGIFGHAQFTWLLASRTDSLKQRIRDWMRIMLEGLAPAATKA